MKKRGYFLSLILLTALMVVGQQQTTDGGYVIGGMTTSYTTGYTGFPDMAVYKLTGSGAVQWFGNYGGVLWDWGSEVIQTSDGGYLIVGSGDSFSFPSDNVELFKLDAGGNLQWRKNYGAEGESWWAISVRQTADGGYIVLGGHYEHHTNGVIVMTKTDIVPINGHDEDILLLKLDAGGDLEWRKSYGGGHMDWGRAVEQTSDGGYILGGTSWSYTHGMSDFLIYKVNEAGAKQWRKNYGGVWHEWCGSVKQTPDGGYVFGGDGDSYTNGGCDFLVYKVNEAGHKQWRKNYGGWDCEHGGYIDVTSDGGYVICGDSHSYTSGGPMDTDFLVYKLGPTGQKQWRKNYGGINNDWASRVSQTSDGGYFISGTTTSYTHGGGFSDFLVYKVNASGQKQWRNNYGGSGTESAGGGIVVIAI